MSYQSSSAGSPLPGGDNREDKQARQDGRYYKGVKVLSTDNPHHGIALAPCSSPDSRWPSSNAAYMQTNPKGNGYDTPEHPTVPSFSSRRASYTDYGPFTSPSLGGSTLAGSPAAGYLETPGKPPSSPALSSLHGFGTPLRQPQTPFSSELGSPGQSPRSAPLGTDVPNYNIPNSYGQYPYHMSSFPYDTNQPGPHHMPSYGQNPYGSPNPTASNAYAHYPSPYPQHPTSTYIPNPLDLHRANPHIDPILQTPQLPTYPDGTPHPIISGQRPLNPSPPPSSSSSSSSDGYQ